MARSSRLGIEPGLSPLTLAPASNPAGLGGPMTAAEDIVGRAAKDSRGPARGAPQPQSVIALLGRGRDDRPVGLADPGEPVKHVAEQRTAAELAQHLSRQPLGPWRATTTAPTATPSGGCPADHPQMRGEPVRGEEVLECLVGVRRELDQMADEGPGSARRLRRAPGGPGRRRAGRASATPGPEPTARADRERVRVEVVEVLVVDRLSASAPSTRMSKPAMFGSREHEVRRASAAVRHSATNSLGKNRCSRTSNAAITSTDAAARPSASNGASTVSRPRPGRRSRRGSESARAR